MLSILACCCQRCRCLDRCPRLCKAEAEVTVNLYELPSLSLASCSRNWVVPNWAPVQRLVAAAVTKATYWAVP